MARRFPDRLAPLRGAAHPTALGVAAAVLLGGAVASAVAQAPPRSQPTLQCPADTPICTYAERRLALDGYRYQMLVLSGGADWDTQFWVSDAGGQLLLAVAPTRGNAYVAAQRQDGSPTSTPAVRVIADYYTPTDPGY